MFDIVDCVYYQAGVSCGRWGRALISVRRAQCNYKAIVIDTKGVYLTACMYSTCSLERIQVAPYVDDRHRQYGSSSIL